jgi:hypothetical protein
MRGAVRTSLRCGGPPPSGAQGFMRCKRYGRTLIALRPKYGIGWLQNGTGRSRRQCQSGALPAPTRQDLWPKTSTAANVLLLLLLLA